MTASQIISLLPYSEPFLFVDTIESIDEEQVIGTYTYQEDAYFYQGHFKNNPITPGVILTETMAQIGLVCLGIYLHKDQLKDASPEAMEKFKIAMSSTAIDFFKPVYPGETVRVVSKKMYFRFGKLKCNIELLNSSEELVAKGEIAGMILAK